MAILANDAGSDRVEIQAGPQPTRALLIAGCPLNEPIAQSGPFVMNTREELIQAAEDYRNGTLMRIKTGHEAPCPSPRREKHGPPQIFHGQSR